MYLLRLWKVETENSYKKIVNSLKRRKKGSTAADICASTALPLYTVNELLPKAADEYSGHLRVTQSGEILYYFPNGFASRFHGFGASLRKITDKTTAFVKSSLVFLFKVWIMVMLIGYFILFIALALATVFIQIAAKSNKDSGRGGGINFSAFDLLWRIWFYQQLTRPRNNYPGNIKWQDKEKKRPMHKAIFSFVFGEDDPNKSFDEQIDKAIISFLQANRGVISLAEYMAFTGENSLDAEKSILSFCSKFDGSPEVTEEGTIVYRFEEILLRSDTNKNSELIPPIKRLKIFSGNSKTMNGLFIAINAVNLLFGSYFFYQSFAAGQMIHDFINETAYSLYGYTHYFLHFIINEPHNFIRIVLGLVPLLFSLFFWIIPAVRNFLEKKENEDIKLLNFKRFSFSKIWSSPLNIDINNIQTSILECRPKDIAAASDRVIKDIGVISSPEIFIAESGKTIYSFNKLEKEKITLEKYRSGIDTSRLQLGDTVFDSGR
jgi:hypothetical protein